MTREEKLDAVQRLGPWWHEIDLGDGVVTPGGCKPAEVVGKLGLPDDLSGRRVIDLGCADGWYSLECAKRNAQSVLAVDHYQSCLSRVRFASWELGLAHLIDTRLADLGSEEEVGDLPCSDVVLCLGLLYKFGNPWLHLSTWCDLIAPGGIMVFETLCCYQGGRFVQFFDASDYPNGAPENVSAPTPEWLEMVFAGEGLAYRRTFLDYCWDTKTAGRKLWRVGYVCQRGGA